MTGAWVETVRNVATTPMPEQERRDALLGWSVVGALVETWA